MVRCDDDAPDAGLPELGDDTREGRLGVSEATPSSAEEAGLPVDVELLRPHEDGLVAVDLLAKGLLAELDALAELEVGDVSDGAAMAAPGRGRPTPTGTLTARS